MIVDQILISIIPQTTADFKKKLFIMFIIQHIKSWLEEKWKKYNKKIGSLRPISDKFNMWISLIYQVLC